MNALGGKEEVRGQVLYCTLAIRAFIRRKVQFSHHQNSITGFYNCSSRAYGRQYFHLVPVPEKRYVISTSIKKLLAECCSTDRDQHLVNRGCEASIGRQDIN